VPHPRLVLNGTEDVVDEDFEWCELFFFVALCRVPGGFDGAGSPILALLGCSKLWVWLFPLITLFRGVVGCALGHIFNLNVFLNPKEVVPHLGDFMFHQVLVKRVGCDLQPTDERCRHIFIAVISESSCSVNN